MGEEVEGQVEALTRRLAKAESAVKRLGEQNLQLMADKEQALLQLDEANFQLATVGDHVRRLNESRAMHLSLRASLQTLEQQLLTYDAGRAAPLPSRSVCCAGGGGV